MSRTAGPPGLATARRVTVTLVRFQPAAFAAGSAPAEVVGGAVATPTTNGESDVALAQITWFARSTDTVRSTHTPPSKWRICGVPVKVMPATSMHRLIDPL